MTTTKLLRQKMIKTPLSTVAQQYRTDLRLRNLSENTIRIHDKVLAKLEAFIQRGQTGAQVQMSHVTPAAAKEFVAARMSQPQVWANHPYRPAADRPLAMRTIHQEVRSLKTFGVWLAANEYDNPFADLKKPKLPKHLIEILSQAEIEQLFRIYNSGTHFGARWQAMLAFFLDTGVRLDELITLTVDQLDMEHFRAKVCGKGNKERYIRFGNNAQRLLARYVNLFRNPDCPRVFQNMNGRPLTSAGMHCIIKNVRAKSGIQRLHFHLFRHTFATNFLMAGGDSFDLQLLLGHESLEMTKRYVHLAQQLSRTKRSIEMKRISPLDELGDFTRQRGPRSARQEARGAGTEETPSTVARKAHASGSVRSDINLHRYG